MNEQDLKLFKSIAEGAFDSKCLKLTCPDNRYSYMCVGIACEYYTICDHIAHLYEDYKHIILRLDVQLL